ncbi:MAG: DUF374 domain-containing protein [Planctomycetota bacterium]|nr:DUF374 domain-containing protein [Planctomycetota bacterium]
MKRWLSKFAGWLLALLVIALRWTCRVRFATDYRPEMSKQGIPYVFAVLHAHQVSGLVASDPGMVSIVSRSVDGEIIVPLIRMLGHEPIRGSSGPHRKGGSSALKGMTDRIRDGQNGILTIDGPRGPRGHVQPGISLLAKNTGAAVLCAVAISERRWILTRAWDRLQIPRPFTRINVAMSAPIYSDRDESLEDFADRIAKCLHELELQYDPTEAAKTIAPAAARSSAKRRRAA